MDNLNTEYPKELGLDGVYVRVKRNGKWLSLCFSDLSESEQENFLSSLNAEGLKRLCCHLAEALRNTVKSECVQ